MSKLFKKPALMDRELDRIQRDVALFQARVSYLSARLPLRAPELRAAPPQGAAGRRVRAAPDERLTHYLSGGSVQRGGTPRLPRRLERNRALLMLAFSGMVLVWAVARFL
jgi:hypothetical protein